MMFEEDGTQRVSHVQVLRVSPGTRTTLKDMRASAGAPTPASGVDQSADRDRDREDPSATVVVPSRAAGSGGGDGGHVVASLDLRSWPAVSPRLMNKTLLKIDSSCWTSEINERHSKKLTVPS
ncbi:hypothetical protein CSOJ01_11523 [Colletotrichum sojae]|uniref:Uncharacterized protein n=1 Tax=Colletotrichum sojae TaxID=2175907 RepID=A0A8H6IXZ8_9PEZI|nr:hypothetical protein CSOJ01_11523 [Colletotrichum sojae]